MIAVLSFIACFCGEASAEEGVKTKYFNIHFFNGMDKLGLLKKMDADYFLRRNVAYFGEENSSDLDSLIGQAMDALYLQVSDIIDAHLYSVTIELDILPDKRSISQVVKSYSGLGTDAPSFYFLEKNTIYISFADLNPGMLAHEMTHAIVNNYFAIAPPMKLQEILAGYSDYSIRKMISRGR